MMVGGDLRTYLRAIRQRKGELLGPEIQAQAAQQMARALNYLESRFIVHRQVAAKNIYVGSSLHCLKLGNFELARTTACTDE